VLPSKHPPVLCYDDQLLHLHLSTVDALHSPGHLVIQDSQFPFSPGLEERKEVWLQLSGGLEKEMKLLSESAVALSI